MTLAYDSNPTMSADASDRSLLFLTPTIAAVSLKAAGVGADWSDWAEVRIMRAFMLEEDWDSEGSLAASAEACDRATRVVNQMVSEGAPKPTSIVADADRGLAFEWQQEGATDVLEIDSAGSASGWTIGPDGVTDEFEID